MGRYFQSYGAQGQVNSFNARGFQQAQLKQKPAKIVHEAHAGSQKANLALEARLNANNLNSQPAIVDPRCIESILHLTVDITSASFIDPTINSLSGKYFLVSSVYGRNVNIGPDAASRTVSGLEVGDYFKVEKIVVEGSNRHLQGTLYRAGEELSYSLRLTKSTWKDFVYAIRQVRTGGLFGQPTYLQQMIEGLKTCSSNLPPPDAVHAEVPVESPAQQLSFLPTVEANTSTGIEVPSHLPTPVADNIPLVYTAALAAVLIVGIPIYRLARQRA